jgi:FixJ family two-component response regulator
VERSATALHFLRDSGAGCIGAQVQKQTTNGLQKYIARERADLPVVVMSGHGDIPTTVQAMKAGAVDFLVGSSRGVGKNGVSFASFC